MNAQPVVAPRRSAVSKPRVARRTARGIGVAVAAALLTSACAAGQQAQTADEHSVIDGQNQTIGSIKLRDVAISAPPSAGRFYLAGTDAELTLALVNAGRSADRLVSITTSAAQGWAAFSDYNDAHTVQQASSAEVTGTPEPTVSSSTPAGSPSSSGDGTAPGSDSTASGDSTAPGGSESVDASGSTSGSASAPGSTPAPSSSAATLPTGTRSVTIPAGGRVTFGLPESTGALLLTGLAERLYPGTTVKLTMTFARAGTATVFVPVQLATIGRTAEVGGGDGEEG